MRVRLCCVCVPQLTRPSMFLFLGVPQTKSLTGARILHWINTGSYMGQLVCALASGFGAHDGSWPLISNGAVSCFICNLFSLPVFSLAGTSTNPCATLCGRCRC